MKKAPHPMQPMYFDRYETLRFKENKIVRFLVDSGKANLNDLACIDFPQEDREQFAQLIGYSVDGFGELGYVRKRVLSEVYAVADELIKEREK